MKYLLCTLFFGLLTCSTDPHQSASISFNPKPMQVRPVNARMVIHDHTYSDLGYRLDVYRPNQASRSDKLPVVLAVHSGGFLKGSKDNSIIKKYAMDIASTQDFVVVTIDYTTIFDIGKHLWKHSGRRSHYIDYPVEDVYDAIDHLVRLEDEYGITTDSIYLFGYSAGGCLVNEILVNSQLVTSKIVGGVSIAGCLTDREPLEYRQLQRPLLMIHGTEDEYVPYLEGRPFPDLEDNPYLDLPGGKTSLTVNDHTADVSLMPGIMLPKSWFNTVSDWLLDDVIGSGRIYERYSTNKDIRLMTIDGGPHQFMINEERQYTRAYEKSIDETIRFLKKTASK